MSNPIIVNDMTRSAVIEGLWELYNMAVKYEKTKDAYFVGWPDMRDILNHIDQNGLPPKS
jgi:hypothetical protein